jgi:hypothetical protein
LHVFEALLIEIAGDYNMLGVLSSGDFLFQSKREISVGVHPLVLCALRVNLDAEVVNLGGADSSDGVEIMFVPASGHFGAAFEFG